MSVRPVHLGRWGLPPTPTLLRNFYATQYTEPERVAVAQLAMRAVGGSGRWQPEQIRPGRLVDHAVEAGRASECASSARTASQSSCVHVATAQSPRCSLVICWPPYWLPMRKRCQGCTVEPLMSRGRESARCNLGVLKLAFCFHRSEQ